jgi:hypothetical protein
MAASKHVTKQEVNGVQCLETRPRDHTFTTGHTLNKYNIIEPIDTRDFYFRALGSLVVLSFPQLVSFFSVFPKPLSETLRRSSDERIPIS